MGGTTANMELAEELLQLEEADAWFEYLESTRGQSETAHSELEPWAWARLSSAFVRCVRAALASAQRRPEGRREERLIACDSGHADLRLESTQREAGRAGG